MEHEELEKEINNIFDVDSEITIENLKKCIIDRKIMKEREISEIIHYLLTEGMIGITKPNKIFDKTTIHRIRKIRIPNLKSQSIPDFPKVVISLPPFDIFGLQSELDRLKLNLNNIEDEFECMFSNAKANILICSPFIDFQGIKRFIPILQEKARAGVKIKIITRQSKKGIPNSRYDEVKTIYDAFEKIKDSISIRDYHYQSSSGIDSSTHAKLIVCDYEIAYIGSGEIRKNSFMKNFEMGVVIYGEQARSVGLIFDKLYSVSTDFNLNRGDN